MRTMAFLTDNCNRVIEGQSHLAAVIEGQSHLAAAKTGNVRVG